MRGAARHQLDITNAFRTAVDRRMFQRIAATSLPQAAIGAQQVGMLVAELLQVD